MSDDSLGRQVARAREAAARLTGTTPRRRHPRTTGGPDTDRVRAQLQQFLNRPQRGGPVLGDAQRATGTVTAGRGARAAVRSAPPPTSEKGTGR